MPENQSSNLRLDSWKSIAAYLGRDVRTVIRWEETRGLPVRRLPGTARSAVYAFKHEIDAWMSAQPPSSSGYGAEASSSATVPALEIPKAIPYATTATVVELRDSIRPIWLWVPIAAGLIATMALFLYMHGWVSRRQPVRAVFTLDSLQAWDDADHMLWEHRFEQPFSTTAIVGSIDPSNGRPYSFDSVNRVSFLDLFGDGRREVLATTMFRRGGSTADHNRQVLSCFDPTGKLLWSYEPQEVFTFGKRTYGPPWVLREFITSDEPGRKTIWVIVTEPTWGKSFIARLDADGHEKVQFVQSGEIAALQRYHTANGAMLWIGGFNDEYDTASVAVMRDAQVYALSPQTAGSHFACVGCGSGDPLAYFVLPRYDISKILHNPNNKVYAINSDAQVVEVRQAEVSTEDQILYDFRNDAELTPLRVNYSAGFWANHLELERQGRVNHSLEKCPDRLHPPPVRVYRNGKWTEVAVPSIFTEMASESHSSR